MKRTVISLPKGIAAEKLKEVGIESLNLCLAQVQLATPKLLRLTLCYHKVYIAITNRFQSMVDGTLGHHGAVVLQLVVMDIRHDPAPVINLPHSTMAHGAQMIKEFQC